MTDTHPTQKRVCSFVDLRQVCCVEEPMPFENREDINSIFPDTVDDTVGAYEDFSDVMSEQFWYYTTCHRHGSCLPSAGL